MRARLVSFTCLSALMFSAPAGAQSLAGGINDLTLTREVTGLNSPTAAEFLPDGRMIIIELDGAVRIRPASGGTAAPVVANLPTAAGFEQGGLGLAIDPNFATNNRVYFYYSDPNRPTNSRHRVGWSALSAANQFGNLTIILDGLYGPLNHNGGGIKFGPDGLLYIATGDTGCNCGCSPGNATNNFPTCLTNLQGKILRIDRDGNIPATNPLVGTTSVPACGAVPRPCSQGPNRAPSTANPAPPATQIYNWGFRNPWRFSFDERTGYMWIGDVGEVTWEEINVSTGPAQHFGWPFREGANGDPVSSCQSTPMSGNCKDPAFEYNQSEPPGQGQGSVTGGVFSNHCSWPAPYNGQYWFADYTKGRVWTLTPNTARDSVVAASRRTIVTGAGGPVHFFNGPSNDVWFVNIDVGNIYSVRPTTPATCPADAGVPIDSGPTDSGVHPDAEPIDSGVVDTGVHPDAEPVDTGVHPDAEPQDSGVHPDAEPADSGVHADAEPVDLGVHPDAEPQPRDAEPEDGGVVADAMSTDASDPADSASTPDAAAADAAPAPDALFGADANVDPVIDTGIVETDAGTALDAASSDTGTPEADESCACSSAHGRSKAPPFLALLLLLLRRRRK